MKRIPDYRCSVLTGATNQKFDKSVTCDKQDGRDATEQSSSHGRLQRSRGILMSGRLMIGLLTMAMLSAPSTLQAASVSIGVSVGIAPPPLPVYVQPVCPGPGYIWTPGYWAYDPVGGYYWIPGTWVMPPTIGFLWTPGYWGWGGAAFIWHAGYWGPHVGFYGGINYGFGYTGVGYEGGYWRGRNFYYNQSVNNFGGAHFTNVYNRTVVNNFAVNRVSYNGGAGGLRARPTSGELAADHERHVAPTSMQRQHETAAHNDRSQFASVNHGGPPVAATARPGELRGGNRVAATRAGGPTNNPRELHGSNPGHTSDYSRSSSPNRRGGGTRQVMTAHQNHSSSRRFSTRQEAGASSQSHSAPAPRYQASRGAAPSRPAAARRQPQQHSSRPSEGGGHEPHGRGSGR